MRSGVRVSRRDTSPRLSDVLGLSPVQIGPGVDALSLQARHIDWGFTRQEAPVTQSSLQSLRFEPARAHSALLDHRLDILFTHRLDFKSRGPLHQGNELLRLPFRLLPSQIASIDLGIQAETEAQGSAMATMFAKLAAAWLPDRTR